MMAIMVTMQGKVEANPLDETELDSYLPLSEIPSGIEYFLYIFLFLPLILQFTAEDQTWLSILSALRKDVLEFALDLNANRALFVSVLNGAVNNEIQIPK
jgi:hypothetical protein